MGFFSFFFRNQQKSNKKSKVKEQWGIWEREGVCHSVFICGMVMTLFLQPLSKIRASCLLSACRHFCPWNWSTRSELQPGAVKKQEKAAPEGRRWGGGGIVGRKCGASGAKNNGRATLPLMLAWSRKAIIFGARALKERASFTGMGNCGLWPHLKWPLDSFFSKFWDFLFFF